MRAFCRSILCRITLATALASLAVNAAAAPPAPIEMGILPTLSARTILNTYRPLREYLEEHLGQPVLLVTAPDYRTFVARTQNGAYRYVITAPHFARLAQREAGYQPLVRVERQLDALLVADREHGINAVEQLRGRRVTTPDPLAIISMLGSELLKEHGLQAGRDVLLQPMPSFNSAVIALTNGESAAAVTAATALKQMPEETRSRLVTLAKSKTVPHVIYLAAPNVPGTEVERVRELLRTFATDPTRGRPFFERTGFGGLDPIDEEQLRTLDPYVADLKQALETR